MRRTAIYGQPNDLFDPVETFHEQTKFHAGTAPVSQRRITRFLRAPDSRARMSHAFKDYYFHETVALPPVEPVCADLHALVAARRSVRRFSGSPASAEQVGAVLWHAAGALPEPNGTPRSLPRRPCASGGALYPIETYVLALRVDGVPSAVMHYNYRSHALSVAAPLGVEELRACLLGDVGFLDEATFVLVLTAMFRRSCEKYGPRGYLFSLLEAGAIIQTATLAAQGVGLESCAWGGYNDDDLNRLLGLNGVDETVAACLILGGAVDAVDR